jgi:2-polyprenyl-3-methyl-5-hydroxy-6-metoxy-1,4-benzoquinol methylase
MKKHKWETVWKDKKFNIDTLMPSLLVSKYEEFLREGDRILDIGCGNGRNSIYLANKGYEVDCFDVADLGWMMGLSYKIEEKINFKKSNLLEYLYKAEQYKAIIVTRVLQYLNKKELFFLLEKIRSSIRPDGFLLISYSAKGGILNKENIDVPKYSYSIRDIEVLLKAIFKNVIIKKGSRKTKHVNYEDDVLTFDVFASNPYTSSNAV